MLLKDINDRGILALHNEKTFLTNTAFYDKVCDLEDSEVIFYDLEKGNNVQLTNEEEIELKNYVNKNKLSLEEKLELFSKYIIK